MNAGSHSIGPHTVTIEPPDAFFMHFSGDIREEDVSRILDLFEAFATGPGPAYQLIEVTHVGHVTPEARRLAGMRQLPPSYAGLVVFGGSFQQQLVAKLVTTAGWFLRGRTLGKPMPVCVKDESAARTWLAERRRSSG